MSYTQIIELRNNTRSASSFYFSHFIKYNLPKRDKLRRVMKCTAVMQFLSPLVYKSWLRIPETTIFGIPRTSSIALWLSIEHHNFLIALNVLKPLLVNELFLKWQANNFDFHDTVYNFPNVELFSKIVIYPK